MRIRSVELGAVVVGLNPGEALLLAEACGSKAEEFSTKPQRMESALYLAMADLFEALAMVGSVAGYVIHADETLADWTLPTIRREWEAVTTLQEVAK